jgi:hypothetical protein
MVLATFWLGQRKFVGKLGGSKHTLIFNYITNLLIYISPCFTSIKP